MSSKKQQHWDDMYKLPLENIPWEIPEPPKELVALVKSGELEGGKALDVACGTGNYSFYLAKHGFNVLGVDFAQTALDIAEKHNEKLQLSVTFRQCDVTKMDEALNGKQFDFILDYSILHHIAPADVGHYAEQFEDLLEEGGKLLLVCYSDKDGFAQGRGKATGTYGNEMFYRPREEIEKLYSGLKEVSYKETKLGKRAHHFAHCFLFEKS